MGTVKLLLWVIVITFTNNLVHSQTNNQSLVDDKAHKIKAILATKEKLDEINIFKQSINQDTINVQYIDIRNSITRHKNIFLERIKTLAITIFNPVIVKLSQFKKQVMIMNTQLLKRSDISWNIFSSRIYINKVTLDNNASFQNNTYLGNIYLYDFRCKKNCSFNFSKLEGSLFMINSLFFGQTNFSSSRFFKKTSFTETVFKNEVSFQNAIFYDTVNLDLATFESGLDLSYVEFKKAVSFRGTLLSGHLDLNNIKLNNNSLDLTKVIPIKKTGKILINILGADIEKLNFKYDIFKLYFPKITSQDDKEKVYITLLHNFKKRSYDKSYNDLYLEYNNMYYIYHNKFIVNFLSKNFWDYSLNPVKGLQCIGIVFVLFIIINALFFIKIADNYKNMKFLNNIDFEVGRKLNPIMRFFYFLPSSIVLTSILCVSTIMMQTRLINTSESKNHTALIYMLLMALFGHLSTLYFFAVIIRGTFNV
jgi:Pentapeptide repeats (9 copies)